MFPRLRLIKAYSQFLIILGSYLSLAVRRKILGETRTADLVEKTHRRNARRIERAIVELKGLFIKVGQMLSIMSNFLPETLTQGLEGLQDAVPPHPYEAIEKRFEEDFGKKPLEIYARFEETPIASASLGQVHVAYLQDGTKVAVKVQYPEIDDIVRSDLKVMKRIFWVLHLIFPVYGLRNVYEEIAEVVMRELDYTYEAKNLETIRKNFEKESDFLFPDVYWDYSTSKILTLRFMEGIKISALQEFQANGIDPTAVATKIIHAYCKQIFIDGVYHADPHPGNLLVRSARTGKARSSLESGEDTALPPMAPHLNFKIVLVDFGATATISQKMRQGITLFAEGLIKRDTRILANAMREMGFVAREGSFEPFEKLVDYFYEKLTNIKIENFRNLDLRQFHNLEDLLELRKIKISFRDLMNSFHVPKDWILLERAMLLAMGLCALLDPRLNPVQIVLPYVERFVLQDRTFTQVVIDLLKEIGISYLQLPHEIHKTLRRLNEGTVSLHIKDLDPHSRRLYIVGHQFLYGLFAITGLWSAFYLRSEGQEDLATYALYGAGGFAAVLLLSMIRHRT